MSKPTHPGPLGGSLVLIGVAPAASSSPPPAPCVEPPAVLPFEHPHPEPTDVQICHTWFGSECATAILRLWKSAADVHRCQLCPPTECVARQYGLTSCLTSVNTYVPAEEAPMFSLNRPEIRWPDRLKLTGGEPCGP